MLLKDFADVTFAHDAGPQEITLSAHFSGPMLVYTLLSSNENVVTATESAGTLTLTPVGPGTAAVTVTASNDGGNLSLTISVTVEASMLPMLADGMSFMDLKMVADPSATEDRIESFDLAKYFRAGILLSFETMTSDAGKVAVYNKRDADDADLTEAELDMAKMADGNMITIQSRAVGVATITVRATNAKGLSTTETFTVTVIDMNTAPETRGSAPDDITGTNRLKIGDSKTVKIDYGLHFHDPDISDRTKDDMWVLTAESSDTSILTLTHALTGAVGKPDEVEVVLTAVGAGTAMVEMKATDSFDRSAEKMFEVQVNHRPQPYGAQTEEADRTTLGEYMGFMDLSAAGGAEALELVASGAGYFSDMDSEDALTCSFITSQHDIDPADRVAIVSVSGTTLSVDPQKVGTMTVDAWCSDSFEDSERARVTVEVDRE